MERSSTSQSFQGNRMMGRALRRMGRIFWADLPLLNFAFLAVGITATECLSLSPPRSDLFWTCLFPLAVPAILYAFRWRRGDHFERILCLGVLFSSLTALALIFFAMRPNPIADSQLRLLYEYSSLANTALLGLHVWRRSSRLVVLFFAPVAAYGALLENGGIALGYFTELGYRLYLGPLPAPLATMTGWISVFYLVMSITWEFRRCVPQLERSALGSALVVTLCALCLDLQLDPLATAVGFWRWNDLLTNRILGVPVVNFIAWASAVLPFSFALFLLQTRHSIEPETLGDSENAHWLWRRIPLILAAAAVLFFGTMAVVEGGFSGPTFVILADVFRNR